MQSPVTTSAKASPGLRRKGRIFNDIHNYIKKGLKLYADGSIYEGNLDKNGHKTGFGTINYFGFSYYQGDFLKGMRHGYGVMKYVGDLRSDLKMREDQMQNVVFNQNLLDSNPYHFGDLNDYHLYEGNWENDMRHGRGKMTWYDGVFFDGEWERGRMVKGWLHNRTVDWDYKGGISPEDGKFLGPGRLNNVLGY